MRTSISPLLFSAVLATIVLAPGCDTAPERNPKTTQTIVLSPDKPSPDFEMDVVSAIRVVLPGPDAGADLVWEIVSNNTKVLEQMSPLKVVPASNAPGSKATTAVSFYALRPGKSVLRFVLVRPNQAVAVPAAKCVLVVRVSE